MEEECLSVVKIVEHLHILLILLNFVTHQHRNNINSVSKVSIYEGIKRCDTGMLAPYTQWENEGDIFSIHKPRERGDNG